MIRERVAARIARAKAQGIHFGGPFIDAKLEGRMRDALATPRALAHSSDRQVVPCGHGGTAQRTAASYGFLARITCAIAGSVDRSFRTRGL